MIAILLLVIFNPLAIHAKSEADQPLKTNPGLIISGPGNFPVPDAKLQNIKSPEINAKDAGKTRKLDPILQKYNLQDMLRILKAEGYGGSAIFEDQQAISFKSDGSKMLLFIQKDGDLQLFYGLGKIRPTLSDINNWNANKRLSRASLDEEGNAVLESDFMMDAGATENQITNFIKMFQVSTRNYQKYLYELVK
ncbi:MAG: YbjN domain-containing protein [Rhodospirillaceae bacterium]